MLFSYVVWASPLNEILGHAIAYGASHVLTFAWGRPVDSLVTDGSTIGLGLSREANYFRAEVATMSMTRNIPLFIASVFTFGGWRLPILWWISVIGVMAVIVLDSIVLVAVTWPALAMASGIAPSAAYPVIAIARMNFGTGGLLAAPSFLGAILGWANGACRCAGPRRDGANPA